MQKQNNNTKEKLQSKSKNNNAKVKPLKSIQEYDKKFFKIMSNTGYLNRQMAYKNIDGMTKSRIDKYIKQNIIQRETDNRGNSGFKLTQSGKDYIRKVCPDINRFYAAQSLNHDLKLAQEYFNLTEQQQNNFINEQELKEIILDRWEEMGGPGAIYLEQYNNHEMSMTDGAYTEIVNGVEVITMLEITTNSYGQAEIESKIELAHTVGMEVRFEKA